MFYFFIKKLLLRGNLAFFISMLLLCLLGNCIIAWNSSRLWGILESAVDVYCLTLLISLLPQRFAQVIKIIVSCFMYIVTAVDLGLVLSIGQPINPTLLLMCLQTNTSEASEAISVFMSWKIVLSACLCIGPIFALHLFLHKKREPRFLQTVNMEKWMAIFVVISLVFSLSLLWTEKKYKYHRLILQQSELELQRSEESEPKTRFYLPVYRLWDAQIQINRMRSIYNSLRKNQNIVKDVRCDFTSPEIILILGESFSRQHAALYGYEKVNTPFQIKWNEKGNLIVFTDAVSRWNTTCESIQSLLSLSFAGDSLDWYERPFITSIMKKAGYDVTLISNQYTLNNVGESSDFIEDMFINIPEVSKKQFTHRNLHMSELDDILLHEYDSIYSHVRDEHRFTIIHFRGMHFDFSQRYPERFAKFKVGDYNRYYNLTEEQKKTIADYDNAILYNDYLINQILERCKNRDAIAIFIPDHGERVYDYDENFGRSLGFTYNEIIPQHEIPMWIWASNSYIDHHTAIWDKIRSASNKPYMTDAIAHTIMSLAGIKNKMYNPEIDIISNAYNSKRPRILRNKADYESIKHTRR